MENYTRIGDWEIDTVIGKNHKGALVTIVERKSRYTVLDYIPSRHKEKITLVMEKLNNRPRKSKAHLFPIKMLVKIGVLFHLHLAELDPLLEYIWDMSL